MEVFRGGLGIVGLKASDYLCSGKNRDINGYKVSTRNSNYFHNAVDTVNHLCFITILGYTLLHSTGGFD